jgi:hypothetical protein
MRKSHYVKSENMRRRDDLVFRIFSGMQLTEVTPAWIRERAKAKRLRLGQVAEAINLPQTNFSKSLNGKRTFTTEELEKLVVVLCDTQESPEAKAKYDPVLRALIEDYEALTDPMDRRRAAALVHSLRTVREGDEETPGQPSGPDG